MPQPNKQNGTYIAHLDPPAILWWCNWESVEQGTFIEAEERIISQAEKEALRQRQAIVKQQREAEFAKRQTAAAQKAQNELSASSPCSPKHPYLQRKGISLLGAVRQDKNGNLLISVQDTSGNVQTLQRIAPDGEKRFLTSGKVHGKNFVIQGKPEKPVAVCEGYATGASIHLACGYTVYVAFSANNIPIVANAVRNAFPDKTMLICADNDETGRSKGEESAQKAKARLALPSFTAGTGTDFNDLHQSEDLQEVRRQLESSENHSAAVGPAPALVSLDMGEFLSMSIPERGLLLSPVLPVQGIGILYAPRVASKKPLWP